MNNLELRKIESWLKRLWLIESEIAIFLLWLQHGALTVAQFAQLSGVWRVTVHEIVGRLIRKWLFLETRSGHKRLVYPDQVDAITHLVDAKRSELTRMEREATKITQILRDVQLQSEHFPRVRFYKGQEGTTRVLNEIKKDGVDISIMSDGQHFYELIDNDFLEQTLDLRRKKKIAVRMMFPSGFEYFTYTQGTYQQELQIRSLPHQDQLQWWMIIRWDKMATHYYDHHFITTTIIHDDRWASMHQYLFERTWHTATSY